MAAAAAAIAAIAIAAAAIAAAAIAIAIAIAIAAATGEIGEIGERLVGGPQQRIRRQHLANPRPHPHEAGRLRVTVKRLTHREQGQGSRAAARRPGPCRQRDAR